MIRRQFGILSSQIADLDAGRSLRFGPFWGAAECPLFADTVEKLGN
jgi:hypothetical protein